MKKQIETNVFNEKYNFFIKHITRHYLSFIETVRNPWKKV